jgi:hypothetical protein
MEVYAPGCNADQVQDTSDATYVQSAFTVSEKHIGIPLPITPSTDKDHSKPFSFFASQ